MQSTADSPTSCSIIKEIKELPLQPPLTLTADEEAKFNKFLDKELPLFEQINGTSPLIQYKIELLNPEPIKQRYRPRMPKMQEIINNEVADL